MNLALVIGNKNYSSWSMRPWVLMRQFDIPFTERLIKFHSADWDAHITQVSPSKLVPILWEDGLGTGFATWDSLAIMERIADLFPDKAIWPRDARQRARARSVAAEMHSGFRALRGAMPMNIRARHPGKGHTPDALKDVARVQSLWNECLKASGGPFLFGDFTAADAMYAPVVTRFQTYGVALKGAARDYRMSEGHPVDAEGGPEGIAGSTPSILQQYSQTMLAAKGVADWINDSKSETEFVAEDEPYATAK